MATDWREAGRRSDATRVLRLYRRAFDNDAKRLARTRAIEALKASGARTVVVLWGGGLDAEELVAAGFGVIAVDNGSMTITADGREVSTLRKRRALQYAAEAGGYQWRWGDVDRYLSEGDGALLDFHGPWSKAGRRAIQAARHMTAVVVTLTPSHDVSADATSALERQMAYQLFLKMSWSDNPRWKAITSNGHVRRLTDYHEDQGRHVFVYLLARKHVRLLPMDSNQRVKMRRDFKAAVKRRSAAYYLRNREAIRLRDNEARRKGPFHLTCANCDLGFVSDHHPNTRYCSPACRHSAKMARQNVGRLPSVPKFVAAICSECGIGFSYRIRGQSRTTCGPECRHQATKTRAREWARKYAKAAVSGTAAEAISNEVAA